MRTIAIAIGLTILISNSGFASIIHVPSEQPTIQGAIDISNSGDTILLARGVYMEAIAIDNHPLTLASQYLFSADPADRDSTIINNDWAWSGINVSLSSGPGTNIMGLTIRKCVFYGVSLGDNTTVANNVIDSCWSYNAEKGCAIVSYRNDSYIGYFSIIGNIIRDNMGNSGTAIYALHNGGEIRHNLIYDNHSITPECGIYIQNGGEIELFNNTICHNYTTSDLVLGSVFVENPNGNFHAYNNIIAFNDAGLGRVGSGEFIYEHNDVYQNTHGDYYNFPAGQTDFSSDPLLAGGTPFDYELTWGSPCINAADPRFGRDPDNTVVDIGALFFNICLGPYYVPGDINGDGQVNGLDIIYAVDYCKFGHRPILTCDCGTHLSLQLAGDVNGSCSFNGIDITYLVGYLKGGPQVTYCHDCPPAD